MALSPRTRSLTSALAAMVMGLVVLITVSLAFGGGSAVAEEQPTYYLPHLVSQGYTTSLHGNVMAPKSPARPHGIVGMGDSVVELQSHARGRTVFDLSLLSRFFDPIRLTRPLDGAGAATVALKAIRGVEYSQYSAVVTGDGPLGVVARSAWEGGAASAYVAPRAARQVVLPLMARSVFTHTSLLQVMNTDMSADNEVTLEVFAHTGALLDFWTIDLEKGTTARVDPAFESAFADLPVNAGDGYLGAMRFTAEAPVAVMALGDEFDGRGATAYVARPPGDADAAQLLPLVRANVGGDTLIAVANVGDSPVDVTITYVGAPSSPSGAGQTFEQSLRIGPRSGAFVDLDPNGRGTVPAPALPRGTARNRGFFGNATVRATGPILAVAWEQDVVAGAMTGRPTVLASAAYNAFSRADLGTRFAVPRARYAVDGVTTQLVVMNPGADSVDVVVDLVSEDGRPLGSSGNVPVAAGQTSVLSAALPAPGTAQALLRSTAPVAVVAYDVGTDTDRTAYWAVKMPAELVDVPTRTPTPGPTATPTASPSPSATPDGGGTPGPTATNTAVVDPGPTILLPVAFRGRP